MQCNNIDNEDNYKKKSTKEVKSFSDISLTRLPMVCATLQQSLTFLVEEMVEEEEDEDDWWDEEEKEEEEVEEELVRAPAGLAATSPSW